MTGYGIIDSDGVESRHIDSGCIYVKGDELPERLGDIFKCVSEIITEWQPTEMAIESVFVNKNVNSALKLGQARGAAICAGVSQNLKVSEYAPKEIKSAVVGTGNAAKEQVQHMMSMLLKLEQGLQSDQADALAIALCHAHQRKMKGVIPAAARKRRSATRWTKI
jgi:crossover junction endodeoxyribonuclease RuvC